MKVSISLFLFFGLMSGFLCWAGVLVLPEGGVISDIYPGVVLGIFLTCAGVVNFSRRYPRILLSLFVNVLFCIAAWRLSIKVGYAGPVPFATAGLLGAFVVALGLLLAWGIKEKVATFVSVVSLSGLLGGAVFQLLDKIVDESDNLWAFVLFSEWQVILFIGIAIALKLVRWQAN